MNITTEQAETTLANIRRETICEIEKATTQYEEIAWYWTYIGTLGMAQSLGLITTMRRHERQDQFEKFYPETEEETK